MLNTSDRIITLCIEIQSDHSKFKLRKASVWQRVRDGHNRRSPWPSSLRHVLSSAARKLGSWVRNPLKAWMCVPVFLHCVVLNVSRGLRRAESPFKESYQLSIRFRK
jgi:hypothetical protein